MVSPIPLGYGRPTSNAYTGQHDHSSQYPRRGGFNPGVRPKPAIALQRKDDPRKPGDDGVRCRPVLGWVCECKRV